MGYILTYFIILTFAITLTILLKKRIEEVIPISIVEIVFVIYIFGLFDKLKMAINVVLILSVIQLVIILIIILKKEKEVIHRFLTPGLFVYSLLFGTSVLIHKDRIFENYDEFNHWGVIVKNMFLYHTFGTGEQSVVIFNEYPPFTAIFQYLFLMIQKVYREDTIIIAQNILYFSVVIPMTKNINWNKSLSKLLLILPIIIFLPIAFYENFYVDILVDGIIGIMFAYVMFCAFEREDTKFKYLKIFVGEVMLILTKTSSIALAIFSIFVILIEKLVVYKKDKQKAKQEVKALLIVFILMMAIVSMWYIKVNQAQKRWDFGQIVETDFEKEDMSSQIKNSFIRRIFFEEEITLRKFTVFSVILLLICLQISCIKNRKDKQFLYYSIGMLVSVPIWIAGLLFMYLTIFDLEEAISLNCFERYVSTILLADVYFQMFILTQTQNKNWKQQTIIIVFILVALLPIKNLQEKYLDGKNYKVMSQMNRMIYTQLRNYQNKLKPTDKLLYIVGTKSNLEYLTLMNNYEIMPLKIKKSIKSNFYDVNSFKNIAKDYTHIFIYQIEIEEKDKIKEAFENNEVQTDILYKVENKNDQITLKLER